MVQPSPPLCFAPGTPLRSRPLVSTGFCVLSPCPTSLVLCGSARLAPPPHSRGSAPLEAGAASSSLRPPPWDILHPLRAAPPPPVAFTVSTFPKGLPSQALAGLPLMPKPLGPRLSGTFSPSGGPFPLGCFKHPPSHPSTAPDAASVFIFIFSEAECSGCRHQN